MQYYKLEEMKAKKKKTEATDVTFQGVVGKATNEEVRAAYVLVDSHLVCYNHPVHGEPCPCIPWSSRTVTCQQPRTHTVSCVTVRIKDRPL